MSFWSIVGLGLIAALLIGIVLLIVGLFRRMDRYERMEEEEANNGTHAE